MTAALERRRIAKRQAAARAERKKKAAISIALNEERKQKLKVCTYTHGILDGPLEVALDEVRLDVCSEVQRYL